MATISITLEDDVYIDPTEWFDNASEADIKEMFELCKKHLEEASKPESHSTDDDDFIDPAGGRGLHSHI